jgi:methyl-accepting chemotaxis protein
MSLRLKFGLPIALLLLLMAVFQVVFFTTRMASLGENWAQRRAQGVAEVLSTVLGPAVEFDDATAANEMLAGLQAMPEVVFAGVRRPDGTMLGALRPERVPASPPGEVKRMEMSILGGQLSVVSLVQGKAGARAVLLLGFSLDELEKETASNTRVVALVALITLLLGILVAILLASVVISPIRQLTQVSDRVVKGDLTRAVVVTTRDEVGTLAKAFDNMVQRLRSVLLTVGRLVARLSDVGRQASTAGTTVSEGVAQVLSRMAETSTLTTQSLDSLKGLAQAATSLRSRVEERTVLNREMAAANQAVARKLTDTAAAVTEGRAAVEQMVRSASAMAQRIADVHRFLSDTTASVRTIAESTSQIERNAGDTVVLSQRVADDARAGHDAVSKTMDGIEKIHGSSTAMARQMGELEERVSAIGKIVDLIDRIAEQTRLLAFNATIIASTSGESGRAFGVVAEQMKDLARRTSDATRDIARLIGDIQQGTRVAVGTMDVGLADVDQGISLGRETRQALQQILASSEASRRMVEAIASSSQEQSRSAQQITGSVMHVANAVNELNAMSSQQARESARVLATTQVMDTLTQEVGQMVEVNTSATRQVEEFFRDTQGVLDRMVGAQAQQTTNAERVARAVGAVEEVARQQAREVRNVEEAIRLLLKNAEVLESEVRRFKL